MLVTIEFRFGSSAGQPNLRITPPRMLLFVGPNNSGKSLVLREVLAAFNTGQPVQSSLILGGLSVASFVQTEVEELIAGRIDAEQTAKLAEGAIQIASYHPVTGQHKAHNVSKDAALKWLSAEPVSIHAISHVLSHYVIALDGATRLKILDPRSAGGELQKPTHVLGRMFVNDSVRDKIRRIGFKAFGKHVVVDPTSLSQLEVKLSDRPPDDDLEEQALNDRARSFHSAASPLSDASDGVKAYIGMIAAVLCSDHRLVLIDEPEAFLHPPLARELGRELSQNSRGSRTQVFAATHSANFLMGCVDSGVDVDVVRLTYSSGRATARNLEATKLSSMMKDPMLRSTGMLSALFHAAAVVCEGDLDRAAYEEINRRLEEADRPFLKDAQFLSSHGKDSLHRIVAPLRELGIPAVAVADLDLVQSGALSELMRACGLPESVWQGKRQVAGVIAEACKRDSVALKKVGITGCPEDVRSALEVLVSELATWGLFLVPVGELERWLPELGITATTKKGWIFEFFERMGSSPSQENYVHPRTGDIWSFLERAASWVSNPDREGMPL